MLTEVKKSRALHLGKVLRDDDFIIFRPKQQYRINSNVILIKSDSEVAFFESGKRGNPSIYNILHTLKKEKIPLDSVKYLLISHAHQDHFANIRQMQQKFANVQTYCHINDANGIRFPFILPKTWKEGLYNSNFRKSSVNLYSFYYTLFSNLYFQSFQLPNRIDGTFNQDTKLKLGTEYLTILQTPGHTEGHISMLDGRKNLYLADFVPNTPWIDPNAHSLDAMIASIKKILALDSNQVHRVIRGHGDIRREPHSSWEIANWSEEKARFQKFLNTIHSTLDLIPEKLKGKEMDIMQITSLFSPKYKRYSAIMTRFFIPPAVTWGIAYVLKLQREQKVHLKKNSRKLIWTA